MANGELDVPLVTITGDWQERGVWGRLWTVLIYMSRVGSAALALSGGDAPVALVKKVQFFAFCLDLLTLFMHSLGIA
jgi:hypothetical protein